MVERFALERRDGPDELPELSEHDRLHLRLLRLSAELMELQRLPPAGELDPAIRFLAAAGRQAAALLGYGDDDGVICQ